MKYNKKLSILQSYFLTIILWIGTSLNFITLGQINDKNEIFIIKDNHLIIADPVDSIFILNDCYYKESSHYSIYCSVKNEIIPASIRQFENTSLYTYDKNLALGKAHTSGIVSMRSLIPHFSIYEIWDSLNHDPDSICNTLQAYNTSKNYFASPIVSSQIEPVIASEVRLDIIQPALVDSSLFLNSIYSWIAKQDSTLQFQKLFQQYETGLWWKNINSHLSLKIFEKSEDNYFGFARLDFDGSELEQRFPDELGPYLGLSISYLFSINNDNITGIEISDCWGGTDFLLSFTLEKDSIPFILLEESLSSSLHLYQEVDNNWLIYKSYFVDFFDCPY